jgi:hypothetical protein
MGLTSACPPISSSFYFVENREPKPKQVYLCQTCLEDWFNLLNNVSQLLWEMDLKIIQAKDWTMPESNLINHIEILYVI